MLTYEKGHLWCLIISTACLFIGTIFGIVSGLVGMVHTTSSIDSLIEDAIEIVDNLVFKVFVFDSGVYQKSTQWL